MPETVSKVRAAEKRDLLKRDVGERPARGSRLRMASVVIPKAKKLGSVREA